MDRRTFIHTSIHTMAGSALFAHPHSINQLLNFNPDNDHVLVVIFLNGGNDGLNTVIPLEQTSILQQLRPHVFMPENQLLPLNGQSLALHPSLPGLKNLYDEGKLKIVRAVGYQAQNYSHFRSTDIWMSGADSDQVLASGWAGRYLNGAYPNYPQAYPNSNHPHPLALELGFGNSLLFQGPLANMSVVLNGERDFYELVSDDGLEPAETFAGEQLAHVKLIRKQSQVYGEVIKNANEKAGSQITYPETNLAGQLRLVARMISGGLQTPMFKVEIGGFDTHAGQVDGGNTINGVHANLLKELNDAIVAFQNDLEQLGIADRVTGMTFSEFGRRIVSNASLGTDHGAAGPMFIFGNKVQGGVIGEDYDLDNSMTYEDNLQFQFDFRQIYGTILEQWLCVPASETQMVLQGNYTNLPIIDPSACNTTPVKELNLKDRLQLRTWPNPTSSLLNISFHLENEPYTIEIYDRAGKIVQKFAPTSFGAGMQTINLNLSSLTPGNYFVLLNTKKIKSIKQISKI